MKTKILRIDPSNPQKDKIEIVAEALANGKLVVFPTETVYGLGANALDGKAVKKIFKAKGRPQDNPLIVHIAYKKDLKKYVKRIPNQAKLLIKKFWPGPLTMIFEKRGIIPNETTANLNSVAIRMPSHKIAHELIKKAKVPVAAPSANLSGTPSTTSGEHVIRDLNGKVDVIIDGGPADIGVESTVVDIRKKPAVLLRPGGLNFEKLNHAINIKMHPALLKKSNVSKPESPGMKYRHYAPKAKLIVLSGNEEKVENAIQQMLFEFSENNLKTAVLTLGKKDFNTDCSINLGINKNDIAKNLFKALRSCDSLNVDIILTEAINSRGLGLAIMNRLEKAALYHVIKL